jgi:hypothetical protein
VSAVSACPRLRQVPLFGARLAARGPARLGPLAQPRCARPLRPAAPCATRRSQAHGHTITMAVDKEFGGIVKDALQALRGWRAGAAPGGCCRRLGRAARAQAARRSTALAAARRSSAAASAKRTAAAL